MKIHATVANVHRIDGQPLVSVTLQPDHDPRHVGDHGWAGDVAHIGMAFELNVTPEAAQQFEPGAAVVISIEAGDRE